MTATPALGLSRRSLADQVTDALVQLILDEGLDEGDPLPSTAELAERFDVSRTVIREALAALAGRGILSRSQGRETVVATPGPGDLFNLLQFRVRRDAIRPLDILECRMGLEVLAARGAAERRTDDDVASLRDSLDRLASAEDGDSFHRADIALHREIAEAAHNPLLVLILDALVDFLHDVRVQATKRHRAKGGTSKSVVEQHRAIVDAIEAGELDGAEEAMRHHLSATADALKNGDQAGAGSPRRRGRKASRSGGR